jgi:hypothetical protein
MLGIVRNDQGEHIANRKQNLPNGICPSCQARVHFESIYNPGDFIACQKCAEMLEIVSQSPFRLRKAFEDRPKDSVVSIRRRDPWKHWYKRV